MGNKKTSVLERNGSAAGIEVDWWKCEVRDQ